MYNPCNIKIDNTIGMKLAFEGILIGWLMNSDGLPWSSTVEASWFTHRMFHIALGVKGGQCNLFIIYAIA